MKKQKYTIEEKKALTTLKLGHFQLSTPSFWITVICILCMFLFLQISTTIYMFNKMTEKFMTHEEKLIELIVKSTNIQ